MSLLLQCGIAFLVGGGFCAIGQLLIDCTGWTPARILVSYVVGGVFLTAVGVYGPLVRFAGAGATVPLTGFGYSLAMGVRQATAQYGLWGALCGGLSATSAGIATAMLLGLLLAVICQSGDK
ncbi:MAG: SpoVA/SpoVAEb family sporulation membrane protein [Clostridia bacterium]|nr:SpoVA/SpoVAEb family sporulation membrane protein [Clostridia bacterium]